MFINDKNGNDAIGLDSGEEGNAITISDKNGKMAILLDSSEGGNRAKVLNKQGKTAVNLSTNKEDGGQVDVYNNQRERRAVMVSTNTATEWSPLGIRTGIASQRRIDYEITSRSWDICIRCRDLAIGIITRLCRKRVEVLSCEHC